jgi:polyisoprenyl-teichoic acid--peptidoglycan teichoic acid transferase
MEKLPQRIRFFISLGIIISIVLVSMALILSGVYQVYFAPATLFRSDFSNDLVVEDEFEERVINVAILGLHNRNDDNTFGDIYYVDTIMVASINFDWDALTLLSVPRDSYVEIYGSGVFDRIRQSYSYGFRDGGEDPHEQGLKTALETLGKLLEGVKLHYYVAMDIEGLRQLIDSMGGVYYNVEEDMIGFTPQESLEAGPQLLDGRGYMTYMTYREPDARDDLNRMKRQKMLLRSTFEYFKEMGLFSYVLPTYTAYREHIRTNLSFNQVASLALFAGERLESNAIIDHSLKGEYFNLDDGSTYYLALDENVLRDLIDNWPGWQN